MNDETMILDTRADLAAFLSDESWAIRPELLIPIRALGLQAGGPLESEARTPRLPTIKGKIAVMPLVGTITHRPLGGLFALFFGSGTSTQQFGAAFDQMMADPSVGGIVIDVDSPGGTVSGVPELTAKIRDARGQGKPIVAVANSMAASAAYHVASAADQLVVTPSGFVGSIGVYAVHIDESAALEAAGINPEIISAGEYKTEEAALGPLTPEARATVQERINTQYAEFVGAVAKGRNVTPAVVRGTFGKGRIVAAENAVSLGMADRVATLEEVLDGMTSKRTGTPRRSAAERALRLAGQSLSYAHTSKLEEGEPSWGSIDKTKLPREAHADHGEADKKSTWKYPHHWISGGTMYLHKGGLNAAWGAAQGARSGQEAGSAVKSHLNTHRKAVGAEED